MKARQAIGALGLAAFAGLGAACGSAAVSTIPSITAHGTVVVSAGILDGESAASEYPDVSDGGQVVVVDSTGKVIGTGTLSQQRYGTLEEDFSFTVTVPGGLTRYGIKVGNNRGTVYESPAEMRQGPSLSLGG